VTLADRGGSAARALANVDVRQALNYATDRTAIAGALFPGLGAATSELTVPGGYGDQVSLQDAYPYNAARARQLLTAAGYPHGFTLKLVTADYGSMNLIAQALQQQWAKVGVTVAITDDANANTYTSAAFGAQFPAFMTDFGQLPLWIEGPALFLPTASFNPYHTDSPPLVSLYDEESRAGSSAKTALDQQIEAYLVHNAWFVPVVTTDLTYYAAKSVAGVQTSPQAPILELYGLSSAG
jgi:peptide/nickel transport system substrate-binding protein